MGRAALTESAATGKAATSDGCASGGAKERQEVGVLGGTLPGDQARILALVDRALTGDLALRPEWARGL